MQFSGFINDCLSGRSQIDWNYYSTAHMAKDIFQAEGAVRFIEQYFESGRKELPLILSPEPNAQYALPPERAIHTVSGFFLGLLIEDCLTGREPLCITVPEYYPFPYLWFLAFLYHDYGYCVAEKPNAPIAVPASAPIPDRDRFCMYNRASANEKAALKQVTSALGITLSPFSHGRIAPCGVEHAGRRSVSLEHALLCELTQKSFTVDRRPNLQFNTGAKIKGHQYNSTVVTRYFNYIVNEHKHVEHGIIGGYLFYDRMIKNYLSSYLSAFYEARQQIPLSEFYYRGRRFSENQLPIFSYIADCIIAHNIWRMSERHRKDYEHYRLDAALGNEYSAINFKDNPLLYILVITDTLDPIKAYNKISPRTVAESINIEYRRGSREISFSSSCNEVDIAVLHKKAKGLEDWTLARCTELKDGAFTLYL